MTRRASPNQAYLFPSRWYATLYSFHSRRTPRKPVKGLGFVDFLHFALSFHLTPDLPPDLPPAGLSFAA